MIVSTTHKLNAKKHMNILSIHASGSGATNTVNAVHMIIFEYAASRSLAWDSFELKYAI